MSQTSYHGSSETLELALRSLGRTWHGAIKRFAQCAMSLVNLVHEHKMRRGLRIVLLWFKRLEFLAKGFVRALRMAVQVEILEQSKRA